MGFVPRLWVKNNNNKSRHSFLLVAFKGTEEKGVGSHEVITILKTLITRNTKFILGALSHPLLRLLLLLLCMPQSSIIHPLCTCHMTDNLINTNIYWTFFFVFVFFFFFCFMYSFFNLTYFSCFCGGGCCCCFALNTHSGCCTRVVFLYEYRNMGEWVYVVPPNKQLDVHFALPLK